MHKLSTIALLASCLAFVAAKPMPSQAKVHERADSTSSSSEPTYTAVKRRRTHNCNQDDRLKKIEAQAWADAGAMADVADEYDNGNEWQPAMNYWMGYDSKKSENFWKIQSKCADSPLLNRLRSHRSDAKNFDRCTFEREKNPQSQLDIPRGCG